MYKTNCGARGWTDMSTKGQLSKCKEVEQIVHPSLTFCLITYSLNPHIVGDIYNWFKSQKSKFQV